MQQTKAIKGYHKIEVPKPSLAAAGKAPGGNYGKLVKKGISTYLLPLQTSLLCVWSRLTFWFYTAGPVMARLFLMPGTGILKQKCLCPNLSGVNLFWDITQM